MIVHHSGKDKAKGARGHSLLRAATDTEIKIDKQKVSITKQRDMDASKPLRFCLREINLGKDSDGDLITSCVLVPNDASLEFEEAGLTPQQSDYYEILVEIIPSQGQEAPLRLDLPKGTKVVELSEWWKSIESAGIANKNKASFRTTRNTVKKAIRDQGLIGFDRQFVWLEGQCEDRQCP